MRGLIFWGGWTYPRSWSLCQRRDVAAIVDWSCRVQHLVCTICLAKTHVAGGHYLDVGYSALRLSTCPIVVSFSTFLVGVLRQLSCALALWGRMWRWERHGRCIGSGYASSKEVNGSVGQQEGRCRQDRDVQSQCSLPREW